MCVKYALMNENGSDFFSRIKDQRRLLRITQTELAVIANTNQQQISRLERGAWVPNHKQAAKISRVLQIPIDVVLERAAS